MPDVNEEDADRQWKLLQQEARGQDDRYFQPGMKTERPTPEDKGEAFLEAQLREARRQQCELEQRYPYMDGGKTVLGPEIFVKGGVLSWKGVNYVPQEQVRALRDLRSVCGIHLQAMAELMYDGGVRFPDSALRLYLLLVDELTLTLPALAESHPAVLPRLPEGLE